MVYKRYIKRNGKLYGPYSYSSRKENGKVISEYVGKPRSLGRSPKKVGSVKKRTNIFPFLFLVLFIFLIGFSFINFGLTGKVGLDIKSKYSEGEILEGDLIFKIKSGELIPRTSRVVISLGNISKEYEISRLIDESVIQGSFYAEGKNLSGVGEGYGLIGEKITYPEIDFDLLISDLDEEVSEDIEGGKEDSNEQEEKEQEEEVEEEIESNESVSENNESVESLESEDVENSESEEDEIEAEESEEIEEELEESEEEQEETDENEEVEEEQDEVEEEESEEDSSAPITGAVVSDMSVVFGSVSKDNSFTYEFEEGKTAKLFAGSVNVEGEKLESDNLKLKVDKKKVVVSTKYTVTEKGYGEEFLGKKTKKIEVPLSDFGLKVYEDSVLDVKIVYYGDILVEASRDILVEETEEILNETEFFINNTFSNFTLVNETITNVSVGNLSINTTQYGASINKLVKWKKNVKTNELGEIRVEVPKSAENISVYKILDEEFREELVSDTGEVVKNISEEEVIFENQTRVSITAQVISGEVSMEVDLKKEKNIFDFFKNIFAKITGRVITTEETENIKEVVIDENATEYEIEYETPGPVSFEKDISSGKEIAISSDLHYENVLVYTNLSEEVPENAIKLYHVTNGSWLRTETTNYDSNNNSLVDYVEWVVPHLSNQSYLLVIEISKAEHLDSDRNFISDIYEDVKELDGNWSEVIPTGDYVRVTFEENLTSEKDITIYARVVNGTPKILVYEFEGLDLIAEFENIDNDEYNKIYLTALNGTQDVFDLKIINGSLVFDHIIDPTYSIGKIENPINNNVVCEGGGEYCHSRVFNESILAYFPFDVMNTSNIEYDWSDTNIEATITGNPFYNVSGGINGTNAFEFDGSSTWIDIPNTITVPPEITLSAWIKTTQKDNAMVISSERLTPTQCRAFQFRVDSTTGYLRFIPFHTDSQLIQAAGTTNVADGEWHHVIGTFDEVFNATVWVDGQPQTSATLAAGALHACNEIEIGRYQRAGGDNYFLGTIDEVMILNKSSSVSNVLDMYNFQKQKFYNLGIQSINKTIDAGYNRVNVTVNETNQPSSNLSLKIWDGVSWTDPQNMTHQTPTEFTISDSATSLNLSFEYITDSNSFWSPILLENITLETYSVAGEEPDTTAPDTPSPTLFSLDGSNETGQDLNCTATISDADSGNSLNVTVEWYTEDLLNFSISYDNDYANGTIFNATLESGNTSKTQNWSCGLRLYDGEEYSEWANSSEVEILNTLPTVSLDDPADSNITFDRTPLLDWTGSDADSDSMTYDINITCSPGCSSDNRLIEGHGTDSYTIASELQYLKDNNFYYNWSVRANDGIGYGSWTSMRKFEVQSLLTISLVNASINFGNMNNTDSKNTSTGDVGSFVLQNDGNVYVNVSINVTSLFDTNVSPTENFQFKIDNSSEPGAFNWIFSTTTWTNAPLATTMCIAELNNSESLDTAEIDLLVTIPLDEGPGNKSSTVTFTSVLGE
jgi:hypothetical protein